MREYLLDAIILVLIFLFLFRNGSIRELLLNILMQTERRRLTAGQDFAKAFSLFLQEAENGNTLAMHDLGRMCADGLGLESDQDAAQEWYARALETFHAAEKGARKGLVISCLLGAYLQFPIF